MFLTQELIAKIISKPKWHYILVDVVLKRMALVSLLLSIFNIVKLIISRSDYSIFHFLILIFLPVIMYSLAGLLMGIYECNVSKKCSNGFNELNEIKKKFSYLLIEYISVIFLPVCLLTAFSPEKLISENVKNIIENVFLALIISIPFAFLTKKRHENRNRN